MHRCSYLFRMGFTLNRRLKVSQRQWYSSYYTEVLEPHTSTRSLDSTSDVFLDEGVYEVCISSRANAARMFLDCDSIPSTVAVELGISQSFVLFLAEGRLSSVVVEAMK